MLGVQSSTEIHGGAAAVQKEYLNLTPPKKQQQCPQPNKKSPAGKTPTGLSTITQHIPDQKKPVYFIPRGAVTIQQYQCGSKNITAFNAINGHSGEITASSWFQI